MIFKVSYTKQINTFRIHKHSCTSKITDNNKSFYLTFYNNKNSIIFMNKKVNQSLRIFLVKYLEVKNKINTMEIKNIYIFLILFIF